MSPLLHQFLSEGRDFLEQISRNLLALETAPGDSALIGELFRLVHTLKGNSGLFEFQALTRVVHAAEDVLDQVRDGALEIDSELIDELLATMDFVLRLLDEIEAREQLPAGADTEAAELVGRLRARLPQAVDGSADADADTDTAPSGVPVPLDWSWLARLDEDCRAAVFKTAQPGGELLAVRYLPEPECFFKGEDPLLVLRNLPQRLGFSLQPVTDWPAVAERDVFHCNLQIDALSGASLAELQEHFRYVPEQVVIYRLPAHALALPTGTPNGGPAVYGDFIAMARLRLAAGDRDGLQAAVDAMLEMINPDLWMASALRWCQRLLAADAALPVLAVLLDAIVADQAPGWHDVAFSASVATDATVPEKISEADHASSARQHNPEDEAMWSQMLSTQRRLLDLPCQPSQWAGRLSALHNTLGNLFHSKGETALLTQLEDAIDAAQEARSFAPLARFLDGEPLPIVAPPMFAVPAQVAQPQDMVPAEEHKAERRNEDGGSDRGARILKVPQEKIDRLMDLIGEMVVAKNALPYLAVRAEDVFGSRDLGREIKAQYAVINRIAEEMQDGIMQVRMLPVEAVFQRFPRLVRDVAKTLGKKVRLVVEGEETEADKNIVDALGDPLIHILRNSLDHGIELPAARVAAGKPEEGRITVRAVQENDRVLIEISDDGKGIDPALVKRKAFEKGLIDEHRLETISDADAVQLVFAAGFSTNDVVSDLSGRGVGMDVVRNSLEKIGGQVRLSSDKGRGTRIDPTLPLSMAVSNVMMVNIGGQHFGVPMDRVVETVRIRADAIHLLKNRRAAVLRGQIVPLFGADELLRLDTPPQPNADGELAVLVARVGSETVGVIVDGFAQTIDVILKPLEGPLAGLAGFGGTALLGDGSVLMVLDLKELF